MQPTSAALTPPARRQQHRFSSASPATSAAAPLPDMTSASASQRRRHCNDPSCRCRKRTPSSPRPRHPAPCVAAAAAAVDPFPVAVCPDRRHCRRRWWCAAWSAIYRRHPNHPCPADRNAPWPICWYWLHTEGKGAKFICICIYGKYISSPLILLTILGHNLLAIH